MRFRPFLAELYVDVNGDKSYLRTPYLQTSANLVVLTEDSKDYLK